MSFGARALIRLGALRHNFSVLKQSVPGARVMAVIKANAFGHGLLPVAQSLPDADSFAVARLSEALALRGAGVTRPIVLLEGFTNADELRIAAEQGFEVVVHDPMQFELLAAHRTGAVTTWLKIDTGMHRLGLPPAEAHACIANLRSMDSVADVRLITHLAFADTPDAIETDRQLAAFRSAVEGFEGAVSIANSAAILGMPNLDSAADRFGFRGEHWIRPGVALFGISPIENRSAIELGLKPVMQFEARLIATKPLPAGASVGYRGRYVSPADTTLGIIAAGYGDGYTRQFRDGTPVLLNDRRVPLIGIVSMDMLAVDLGPDATDRAGDVATLWGDGLPIEEVSPWAGAIAYELATGVMHREHCEVID